jgi:hypothetical protein
MSERVRPTSTGWSVAPALALVWPVLVAALVRAVLAWDASDAPLLGDEATLQRFGRLWQQHGVYVGEWPPVYPWLLSTLHGLCGEPANVMWARAFNALCSTLVVVVTMGLAREVGGRRAALLAGWFAALSPALSIWAALLYTEALFVLVFVTSLWLLVRMLQDERTSRAAPFVVGALLGFGALIRAAGLILLFAVALGAALARVTGRSDEARSVRTVRASAEGLAILVTGLCVLLPWVVRNTLVIGEARWASATGSTNMALGWSGGRIEFERVGIDEGAVYAAPLGCLRRWLEAPGPEVPGTEVFVEGTNMETYAAARLGAVLREHPGWALRSRLVHVSELCSPLSFAHRAVRTDQLDGVARHALPRRVFTVGGAVSTVLLFALALVGVARRGYSRAVGWLAAAVAAAHLVVPLLMFGISRFRAPLDPLILVFAALAFVPLPPGKLSDAAARHVPWVAVALAALFCVTLAVMAPVAVAALRATW